MNKKIWIGAVVLVLVIVGVYAFGKAQNKPAPTNTSSAFNPLNATYNINGQLITLVGGTAEMPAAPGSASNITTTVFGQPISGDLNDDGTSDAALVLMQNTGGSGTFYYIAAAIDKNGIAEGTNAVLLGDRIAPQNTLIQSGQIIVNYADRKPGEPMSDMPSVGISMHLTYDGSLLKISTSSEADASTTRALHPYR